MRIAYVTQAYPPTLSGPSICVNQLAHAMAKRGHEVLVIAPSSQGRPYSVQEGSLRLVRLRSYHNPLRVRQRFMLLPMKEAWLALSKFRPHFIHSHDPLHLGLLAIRYARARQIPIAVTAHQMPWFLSGQFPELFGLREAAEAGLWKYAAWFLAQHDEVISPTRTIASILTQRTRLHPRVISNGVGIHVFRPAVSPAETLDVRQRLDLPPDAPIILHVGQLHAAKRVDCILQAAAPILRHTSALLVIAGDGPQKAALMKMSGELGIAEKVRFTGFIALEEGLPEVYRTASLFATASEIETQGIVLLEAAASGLPIAAVNATCIPEIVHDGENGFLVPPGNVNEMGRAMSKIITMPSLARTMGLRSRALAEGHDIERTMDAHEQLYREGIRILAGPAARGTKGKRIAENADGAD